MCPSCWPLFAVLLVGFSVFHPQAVNRAVAAQLFVVEPDGQVTANISRTAMSRIRVVGDRIGQVRTIEMGESAPAQATFEHDSETGDLYVLPLNQGRTEPISLFITTEQQDTYQLILRPLDIPAEQVFIRNPALMRPEPSNDGDPAQSTPYHAHVIELVTAMRNDRPLRGFRIVHLNREISLWDNTAMVRSHRYEGRHWIGEVYRLLNETDATLWLEEREFYRPGVRAVKLDRLHLAPGEETRIYLISKPGGSG